MKKSATILNSEGSKEEDRDEGDILVMEQSSGVFLQKNSYYYFFFKKTHTHTHTFCALSKNKPQIEILIDEPHNLEQ